MNQPMGMPGQAPEPELVTVAVELSNGKTLTFKKVQGWNIDAAMKLAIVANGVPIAICPADGWQCARIVP